jgi:naphtho-gamma-pyrone polyketide synthase
VAISNLVPILTAAKNIPPSSWAYVSAIGHSNVTISGPSSTLKGLFSEKSQLKPIKTSVDAPFHAPHLFTIEDVASILSRSFGSSTLKSYTPRIPVFSNETGSLIEASNYASLLQVLLTEALLKPLRWGKLLDRVPSTLKTSGSQSCNIIPFAANGLQSLSSALTRAGIPEVYLHGSKKDTSRDDGRRDARKESKIAIIGFSGRFPESDNADEFWELLFAGVDAHKEVPKERWDYTKYFDPTGKTKNTSGVTKGCWIKNPGFFDARFFNMSPREAAQADPAQRLAIMTAYEALEMAGIVPDATPSTQRDRVGIFYGMTSDDWREVNSGQNIDTYFIPGGNRAFTPGRIK